MVAETMTKTKPVSIEELWQSATTSDRHFSSALLTQLPTTAHRYLEQAIAPDTSLASAVRLWMHGDIKLGEKWHSFQGEEVICWHRGMIWRARTWMGGLPIWGADRIVDGVGDMQWKILGLFPVVTAVGEDVTRSARGRLQGEAVWLPSVLCQPDIVWTQLDQSQVQANFTTGGESAHLIFTVSDSGTLEQVKFDRWGNPEGGAYHYVDFGVLVEKSELFEGYTIPSRIRAGWFFCGDRFESEGEFFRCTIDKAIYR